MTRDEIRTRFAQPTSCAADDWHEYSLRLEGALISAHGPQPIGVTRDEVVVQLSRIATALEEQEGVLPDEPCCANCNHPAHQAGQCTGVVRRGSGFVNCHCSYWHA